MAHRILFYVMSIDPALVDAYLDEHGLRNEFEVIVRTHGPMTTPSREDLEGVEGILGEFMPARGKTVEELAEADVRLMASLSIGVNHMDVQALADHGIVVTNCPGYCAQDVALHAVALMLDLERQISFHNRRVIDGEWLPKGGYQMHRTQGQTCGLVFFGRIARQVVPIVQALGMHVLVWAPTKTSEELAAAGCEKAESLDELLVRSDVVSLHCPLIPETKGLFGAYELALMKPTAFLINTARGAVVDEDALADALEQGVIQGAGIDVFADESHPNQRLIHAPNCIVTPHCAYVSEESDEELVRMGMDAATDLLVRGMEPYNIVRP